MEIFICYMFRIYTHSGDHNYSNLFKYIKNMSLLLELDYGTYNLHCFF